MEFKLPREKKLKDGRMLLMREAEADDAAEMLSYLKIIGGETDNLLFGKDGIKNTEMQERKFLESAYNDKDMVMIAGFIDGELAATCQIGTDKRKRIAHNAELAISVRKDFWKLGVGSALMSIMIEWAEDRGDVKNILLTMKAANERAGLLYKKFGFKECGRYCDYFNIDGRYDDAILMQRKCN